MLWDMDPNPLFLYMDIQFAQQQINKFVKNPTVSLELSSHCC